MPALLAPLLALLLTLAPGPASGERAFLCDGDLLLARADNGSVDAVGIPNVVAGTVPGAFVVLRWRDLVLQLPRTNNAGAPSYSDGKWWWSLDDPAYPSFRLRQGLGMIQEFRCEPGPLAG
ncbi:MAG: hypothetical protein AB1Z22_02230 [Synechococcaceae cyanobacterium]